MMTGNGTPDCARAARVILRAATRGLLPLAIPPPDCDDENFMKSMHLQIPETNEVEKRRLMTPKEARALKVYLFLIFTVIVRISYSCNFFI